MSEYIIENLNTVEIKRISNSPDADTIEWFPEDPFDVHNASIVVIGTDADMKKILAIIGRK